MNSFLAGVLGTNTAGCACAIAVSVAFGANATATADPSREVLPTGTSGQVGDAVSLSFSGDGPATSLAVTGGTPGHGRLGAGPGSAQDGAPADSTPDDLATAARDLVAAAISANGQTISATDPLTNYAPDPTEPVSVMLTSTGPLSSCAATSGCAVAVGIAVGGEAMAGIGAATCAGSDGAAVSVAVALQHDADSSAARGNGQGCAAGGSTPAQGDGAVHAVSGNTGAAYGLALTTAGPAGSIARSGALGTIVSSADGRAPANEATASSGATGDAAGVAIGATSADSTVETGNSGSATAACVQCAAVDGGTSLATSGDTGSSYALAGAGLAATTHADSGNSGPATARAFGSRAARSSGGSNAGNAHSAGDSAAGNAHAAGGSATGGTVRGRSGDTGNAFGVAVDLATWVTVSADSGSAGAVVSLARGPAGTPGNGSTVRPSGPSGSHVGTGRPTARRQHPALLARAALPSGGHTPASHHAAAAPNREPASSQHRAQPRPAAASPASRDSSVALTPAAFVGGAPRLPANRNRTTRAAASQVVGAAQLGVLMIWLPALVLVLAGLAGAGIAWRRRRI